MGKKMEQIKGNTIKKNFKKRFQKIKSNQKRIKTYTNF
jgi:hypothetical protein